MTVDGGGCVAEESNEGEWVVALAPAKKFGGRGWVVAQKPSGGTKGRALKRENRVKGCLWCITSF